MQTIPFFALLLILFLVNAATAQVSLPPETPSIEWNSGPVNAAQSAAVYADLASELNSLSYCTAMPDGKKLYFRYEEKFREGNLDFYVYNWQRKRLLANQVEKRYGMNWMALDVSEVCELDEYYVLEVYDENKVLNQLRFRFTDHRPPQVELQIADQVCKSGFEASALISGGVGPYKVQWYVSPAPYVSNPRELEQEVYAGSTTVALTVPAAYTTAYVIIYVEDARGQFVKAVKELTFDNNLCPGSAAVAQPQQLSTPPRFRINFSLRNFFGGRPSSPAPSGNL